MLEVVARQAARLEALQSMASFSVGLSTSSVKIVVRFFEASWQIGESLPSSRSSLGCGHVLDFGLTFADHWIERIRPVSFFQALRG